MIATCPQQNGNGGKAMKNGNHTSQRKGGGGGGASAEVKPEDLIQERALNYAVRLPDDVQAQIDSGELGNNAKELFSSMSFSKSEKDAAQKAREEAERMAEAINYLRNGLPDRPGPKITTQEAFNKAIDASFSKLDKGTGLVEWQAIRRDLGNRVSRKDFDSFAVNTMNTAGKGRVVSSSEGSFSWGTPSAYDPRMLDSVATKLGKLRTYAKRQSD